MDVIPGYLPDNLLVSTVARNSINFNLVCHTGC